MDQDTLDQAAKLINQNQLIIFPTDTIYGLLGKALEPTVVDKIYQLRRRTPSKPLIVLISKLEDLKLFNITLSASETELLTKFWPNPVSIILACPDNQFEYLHRGTQTLAFRLPANQNLLELLTQTGPLVAPSANFEGDIPAKNIAEAKNYFQDKIAMYVDAGDLVSKPSTLISLNNGQVEVLRQGAFQLPD